MFELFGIDLHEVSRILFFFLGGEVAGNPKELGLPTVNRIDNSEMFYPFDDDLYGPFHDGLNKLLEPDGPAARIVPDFSEYPGYLDCV